jgi:FkbH-like protein
MHHIVSDGWSMGVLIREFAELYGAYREGRGDPLPALPIQYADYAQWQRHWLQGEVLERQLSYWREQLSGAAPVLELPTDRPRLAVQSHRGASLGMGLDAQLSGQLKVFAREQRVTVFAVLLTSLNILLSRWSNQRDIVIGTVSAGRTTPESEQMIGCFINMLPIRTVLSPTEPAAELLRRSMSNIVRIQECQHCPFDVMVKALNPRRTLSHNPVFNVALVFQKYAGDLPVLDGVSLERLCQPTDIALLDLRFVVEEAAGKLMISCEYSTDLFDGATITDLLRNYTALLLQLMCEPSYPVERFAVSLESRRPVPLSGALRPLVVASTFVADPLTRPLQFWAQALGIPLQIQLTPYGQAMRALLDPRSLLARNSSGFNVMLIRVEDWIRDWTGARIFGTHAADIRRCADETIDGLTALRLRTTAPMLVCLCPCASSWSGSERRYLEELECYLVQQTATIEDTYCVTHSELMRIYAVARIEESYADKIAHVPYTEDYYVALATMVIRRVANLVSTPYKAIVVDCDNTLWKGECGQGNAAVLELTPLHLAFQDLLIRQHAAGTLLCLCSKNDPADVENVFKARTDMRIQLQHIAASRINWAPKSRNLLSLAKEMNLGLDSFIFIDDSESECAEVQAYCPAVLALCLPQDLSGFALFRDHTWAFDRRVGSPDAERRNLWYRQNRQRTVELERAPSFAEFLRGLNVQVRVSALLEEHLDRAAELTVRTNQFNLTVLRRSAGEIRSLCGSGALRGFVVHANDRFGDHGLVGLVLLRVSARIPVVDTHLVSCRVLGLGVVERVLNWLGELLAGWRLPIIELHCKPTQRNLPAREFLTRAFGQFEQTGADESTYSVPVQYAAQLPILLPADYSGSEDGSASEIAASPATEWDRLARRLRGVVDITREMHEWVASRARAGNGGGESSGLRGYEAPRGEIEVSLANIWRELLLVDRVGRQDNFFELGGHSLLAVRVAARVRRDLEVELPLVELFQSATLATMADAICTLQLGQFDAADVERAFGEVEELSDEEVLSLWAAV